MNKRTKSGFATAVREKFRWQGAKQCLDPPGSQEFKSTRQTINRQLPTYTYQRTTYNQQVLCIYIFMIKN